MEMTAPARDIEELVAAFAGMEGTELAQMKELWRVRNFSFIHEARPKDVIPSFYAQALFSSALSHMVGDASLSWRLGGLYVLYTLHGTQPQDTFCRIYLSLEELEALYSLVKELKRKHLKTALKVLQKMFVENMFLFGSVSANQKRIAATVDRLASQAKTRVQQARSRLLTNGPMCQHLEGHLVQELGLYEVSQLTTDYAAAKRRALSQTVEGEVGLTSIDEEAEPILGVELMKDAESWDSHKRQLLNLVHQGTMATVDAKNRGCSEHPKEEDSHNQKRRKTTMEYERDMEKRKEPLDSDDEIAEELDRALENV